MLVVQQHDVTQVSSVVSIVNGFDCRDSCGTATRAVSIINLGRREQSVGRQHVDESERLMHFLAYVRECQP